MPENILTLAEAVKWRENLRAAGKKVVVTNGCFDLLHRGHAEYLTRAAALGDALLVLVNSDRSVKMLKGSDRPVNTAEDRAFLLGSLKSVSKTVIFDSARCDAELAALAPDIYTKAGDYTLETLDPAERDALQKAGSKIIFLPFIPGHSTTATIAKLK